MTASQQSGNGNMGNRVITKESPISLGVAIVATVALIGAAGFCWDMRMAMNTRGDQLAGKFDVVTERFGSMDVTLKEIKVQQREDSKILHANAAVAEGTRQRVDALDKRVDRLEQRVQLLENHKPK